ncbi:hypothetical protein I549_1923 [Mycobacterium avium subsp. avium 2285 (R)]|nr:hypothetical protein I549_1923 [Mycobacterium avium subsp. avium 2285 (R)]
MKIETQADVERLMAERNISFVFRPSITAQPDGTWIARYPGADWSVSGRDAEEARRALHAEELTRMRDPNNADWKVEAVRRHLTEGPIDGVYQLDNETADRVIDDGTQAALDAEIAAIDQQRERP